MLAGECPAVGAGFVTVLLDFGAASYADHL